MGIFIFYFNTVFSTFTLLTPKITGLFPDEEEKGGFN